MKVSIPALIITGLSGSGKSTVAYEISKQIPAQTIELGHFVLEDARHCQKCHTVLDHANHVFRFGEPTKYAISAVKAIKPTAKALILIGPRLPAELNYLRAQISHSLAIMLDVRDSVRLNRRLISKEKSEIDSVSCALRDSVERSWGADETLKRADFAINGEMSIDRVAKGMMRLWSLWAHSNSLKMDWDFLQKEVDEDSTLHIL